MATPRSLVRPAIDAFIRGLFLGALPGWLLGMFARVVAGPKLASARATKRR